MTTPSNDFLAVSNLPRGKAYFVNDVRVYRLSEDIYIVNGARYPIKHGDKHADLVTRVLDAARNWGRK